MSANPRPLKDLCIDTVCDHINLLTTPEKSVAENSHCEPELTFVDGRVFLPMEISEVLLTKLSEQRKLNGKILSLFSKKNVYLRNVMLPRCNDLNKTELKKTLKNHKLNTVKICRSNFSFDDIVDIIGDLSTKNLETLCISYSSFVCDDSNNLAFCLPDSIFQLENLRSLDVSKTQFNTTDLLNIVTSLQHLDSLNISSTNVDSFAPLLESKNQLKKLIAYNLKIPQKNAVSYTYLKSFTSLIHLDLSSDHFNDEWVPNVSNLNFLIGFDYFPNLVILDISIYDIVFGQKFLEDILKTHKKLRFLGLMDIKDSNLPMFTVHTDPLYNPDLVVTGVATRDQLLTSLKCYSHRTMYVIQCLSCMYECHEKYHFSRYEFFEVISFLSNCILSLFFI